MVKAFAHAIALTGGIATGKSTVVEVLKRAGYAVIDADLIAHEILDSQYEAIATLFGEEYIRNKKVDRKALGSIIFGNELNKTALESLLHPLIFDEIKRRSEHEEAKEKQYFIDIPLFFESSRYPIKKSLLVYTTPELQLQRLMLRNNLTQTEAKARINSQMPLKEKIAKSHYLIDNSATLTDLKTLIQKRLIEIKKDFR